MGQCASATLVLGSGGYWWSAKLASQPSQLMNEFWLQ